MGSECQIRSTSADLDGRAAAGERLYLAAALSVAIYVAFFAAALARPLFGGSFYDKNGCLPFKPPFGPDHWRWDVNVTAFTILTGILVVGIGVAMAD